MDRGASEETPAVAQFSAWLEVFNTGDRDAIFGYHDQHFPYEAASRDVATIDIEERLSKGTGGFDIKKYCESSMTAVTVIMKERNSRQFAHATMEVNPVEPHQVVHFKINPIATPIEFLSPDDPKSPDLLDNAKRKWLIERIASEIQTHYVFPDVSEKIINGLRQHYAHGDYDSIIEGEEFADTVAKQLHSLSHDLHLQFFYDPDHHPPKDETPAERLDQLRGMNFGFGRIDRLEGNIAHLIIHGFIHLDEAIASDIHEAIGGLMSQVADADALLLDLRQNGGGDPAIVALVASYLFDSTPVHLNDIFHRKESSTKEYWTTSDVHGTRFGRRKPIYVLTSKDTFSGGEELAYDLQCLTRAKVIGETTGGGAHPSEGYDIDDWFHIAIPFGRPINPITKTNWEGVGVVPDIPVPASDALEEGRRRATEDIFCSRIVLPRCRCP